MFDSTTPKKEVLNTISALLDRSIPKSEIFQQIKSKYPQYNEDSIAKGIAVFISDDVKNKYKIHAYLLSMFVIVSIFFSMITPPLHTERISTIYNWVVRILISIISFYFINGFLRFKLSYLTTAVSFYSLYLLMYIYFWIIYPISFLLILSSIGSIITFIFLYLFRKLLFPNIDLWGNVKKENGNYKF